MSKNNFIETNLEKFKFYGVWTTQTHITLQADNLHDYKPTRSLVTFQTMHGNTKLY